MRSTEIELLTQLLSTLPGIGPRSARRIILQLIKNKNTLMKPLYEGLDELHKKIKICENCGNYSMYDNCEICTGNKRDKSILCIVEEVSDLWAIERGRFFNGLYFLFLSK